MQLDMQLNMATIRIEACAAVRMAGNWQATGKRMASDWQLMKFLHRIAKSKWLSRARAMSNVGGFEMQHVRCVFEYGDY